MRCIVGRIERDGDKQGGDGVANIDSGSAGSGDPLQTPFRTHPQHGKRPRSYTPI